MRSLSSHYIVLWFQVLKSCSGSAEVYVCVRAYRKNVKVVHSCLVCCPCLVSLSDSPSVVLVCLVDLSQGFLLTFSGFTERMQLLALQSLECAILPVRIRGPLVPKYILYLIPLHTCQATVMLLLGGCCCILEEQGH